MVYPTAIENVIRQFGSVDEFQVTGDKLSTEMHQLEIEIEVLSGNDSEHVRTHVEQSYLPRAFRCARQSKWQKPARSPILR